MYEWVGWIFQVGIWLAFFWSSTRGKEVQTEGDLRDVENVWCIHVAILCAVNWILLTIGLTIDSEMVGFYAGLRTSSICITPVGTLVYLILYWRQKSNVMVLSKDHKGV